MLVCLEICLLPLKNSLHARLVEPENVDEANADQLGGDAGEVCDDVDGALGLGGTDQREC